ncbi:MAG: methyltransferase domain-containing protein [Planctomycetes bacterium]|nr:methyltransferase domain-containing protein [Planctomycetota bacterium]
MHRAIRRMFDSGQVMAGKWFGMASGRGGPGGSDGKLGALNRRLLGYPNNHNYQIRGQRRIPSHRLAERWRVISSIYPKKLESFLDVGCCKGFFVLENAARPECKRSVGIDVVDSFVDTAREAGNYMNVVGAEFHSASLDDVAGRVEEFGGPFQVVQLINTYHYLFWGSNLNTKAYGDHRTIFSMFHAVTSSCFIFSSPLEVKVAPQEIRDRAAAAGNHEYHREAILDAAQDFFDVIELPALDTRNRRPLLLMVKRANGS